MSDGPRTQENAKESEGDMGAATGAVMAASVAAQQAAIIHASNGSGLIVRVHPEEFGRLLKKATPENSLLVQDHNPAGFLSREAYHYLLSYKGLAFVTKSDHALDVPPGLEIVIAESIYVPV